MGFREFLVKITTQMECLAGLGVIFTPGLDGGVHRCKCLKNVKMESIVALQNPTKP